MRKELKEFICASAFIVLVAMTSDLQKEPKKALHKYAVRLSEIDIEVPEKEYPCQEELSLYEENTVDEEELYILAHVINGEAGAYYCSDEMRYGVGSVVLNRVNHKDFPNDIKSVVFQQGQYACTWSGLYDWQPTDASWRIAEDLLRNGSVMPDEVVFQSQSIQGSGIYKQIGNQYFCYR